MIDNLRIEHFDLGKQNTHYSRTNNAYGTTKSASKREVPPWAHLRTNFEVGTDADPKRTDYASRFSKTQTNFSKGPACIINSDPNEENKRNKAKICSDSVKIAEQNFFDSTVSSKLQF